MRYCHECGAEVATDDAFCAFCGITLEPIPLAPQPLDLPPLEQVFPPVLPSVPENSNSVLTLQDSQSRIAEESISETSLPSPLPFDDEGEGAETISGAPNPVSLNFVSTEESERQNGVSDPIAEPAFHASPASFSESQSELAENIDESDEFQIATIPNINFGSLVGEADIPIEEIRQDEEFSNENPSAETQSTANVATSNLESQAADIHETAQESESVANVDSNVWETGKPQTGDAQFISGLEELSQTTDQTPSQVQIITADEAPVDSVVAADKLIPEYTEEKTLISEKLSENVLGDPAAPIADAPRPTSNQSPHDTPGSKSPKLKPLEDGTLLNNRYEIIRRIGGGGMGAVYLAKDRNLGGVMRAVKEMIQAYVDESQQEKAVEDFRRESIMLTALEHPSIPTIYDYFYDENAGRFYLVMKYISGGDLAARFRASTEGVIEERSMTEWAIQVADVLDYLHKHDPPIVYRDLKPSNVMLEGNSGKVMLIDFGIARWLNKEEKGVTAVGTMGYAPPELFAGNAEPRSDIYSLGATMFHLLTGSDPQNNPLLIFDFTKNPRPRQINPNLSVEMEAILLRAVEYNASLRFASAAEMRDALLAHLERIKAGRLTFMTPEVVTPVADEGLAPITASNWAFCGFCGERIAATDMFCAYCGSKQPEAARVQAAAKVAFPINRATAKLVIETGALDAPSFKLEKESNLVGRADPRSNIFPEIDLTKFDAVNAKISRRHARIWRQGTTFMVEDLGSANGTTIMTNDNKTVKLLAHQPHALTHGDRLRLGETTLHFLVN